MSLFWKSRGYFQITVIYSLGGKRQV